MPSLVVALAVLLAAWAPTPAAAYTYAMSTHPVPEAYRAALAATKGEASWAEANRALAEAYQQIEEAERLARKPLAEPVEQAVAARDRGRILEAFHEAILWVIRYKLDRAEEHFDDPKRARALVRQAELIYEPVDPLIKARDPEKSRTVGQGFLRLRDALGSESLFGFGGSPPDRAAFGRIKEQIERTIGEELHAS